MSRMEPTPVVPLPTGRAREQRVLRAVAARRRLGNEAPRGRAWINGREVGGEDPRYAHLYRSHD